MIGLRKFRLVSAEARGGGTRDESLKESAWEARVFSAFNRAFGDSKDSGYERERAGQKFKMAETSLIFSSEKTSFDPQVKGCLIIGQPRHLQNVSFKDFSGKISTRVDATVRLL